MKYNQIANCDIHQIGPDISESSFQCQQCLSSFYLKNYECIERTLILTQC